MKNFVLNEEFETIILKKSICIPIKLNNCYPYFLAFGSVAEIVKNIRNGTIQGILLDAYIAGEYQDQLRDLRLHQVIDYVFSYGVVLSRDGLALKDCFNHFLESQQSQIYATISKVIKPLKVCQRFWFQ